MNVLLLRRLAPYLIAAGALLLVWLWHLKKLDEAEDRGHREAQVEYAAELEKERQHQREVNDELDRMHFEQIETLSARVDSLRNGSPIRVCRPARQLQPSAGASVTAQAGDASRPTYEPGPDIRGRLVDYGARCEELRQQVEGWQRWYASLTR